MAMFGREDARFTENAGTFLARLWLPEADADGVIPQDDTFMAKPAIDLSRYKAKAGKQTILLDYSRAEVNEMQILKQADVVMLNYLLPERFTPQQCAANLAFYEPRTIHDSSLSKAIHGIVLARCGDTDGAYAFWRDGIAIDLGTTRTAVMTVFMPPPPVRSGWAPFRDLLACTLAKGSCILRRSCLLTGRNSPSRCGGGTQQCTLPVKMTS